MEKLNETSENRSIEKNPSRKRLNKQRASELKVNHNGLFSEDYRQYRKDYYQYIREVKLVYKQLSLILEKYYYIASSDTQSRFLLFFEDMTNHERLLLRSQSTVNFILLFDYNEYLNFYNKKSKNDGTNHHILALLNIMNNAKNEILEIPMIKRWMTSVSSYSALYNVESIMYVNEYQFMHYSTMTKVSPLIANYIITTDLPPSVHLDNLQDLEDKHFMRIGNKIFEKVQILIDVELKKEKPKNYLIKEYREVISRYNEIITSFENDEDDDAYAMADLKRFIAEFSSGVEHSALDWGETIIQYDDNHLWESLGKACSDFEASAMNHCGNSGRANISDKMYSLRRKLQNGKWKVLLTVTVNNGYMMECKAYGNSKPSERLHPYIVDFLLNQKANILNASGEIGFDPDGNFQFHELADDLHGIVLRQKPFIDSTKDYILMPQNWEDWNLLRVSFKFNKDLSVYEWKGSDYEIIDFVINNLLQNSLQFQGLLYDPEINNKKETFEMLSRNITQLLSIIESDSKGIYTLEELPHNTKGENFKLTYHPENFIKAFHYNFDNDGGIDYSDFEPNDGIELRIVKFKTDAFKG